MSSDEIRAWVQETPPALIFRSQYSLVNFDARVADIWLTRREYNQLKRTLAELLGYFKPAKGQEPDWRAWEAKEETDYALNMYEPESGDPAAQQMWLTRGEYRHLKHKLAELRGCEPASLNGSASVLEHSNSSKEKRGAA
jgi:hypothetical protein